MHENIFRNIFVRKSIIVFQKTLVIEEGDKEEKKKDSAHKGDGKRTASSAEELNRKQAEAQKAAWEKGTTFDPNEFKYEKSTSDSTNEKTDSTNTKEPEILRTKTKDDELYERLKLATVMSFPALLVFLRTPFGRRFLTGIENGFYKLKNQSPFLIRHPL